MRILCPHCGERSLDEFIFQGEASIVRPAPDGPRRDEAFYAYGYERPNPAGPHDELWFHNAGCHALLVVTRDTCTHEIFAVRMAKDVALARLTGMEDTSS